MSALKARTADIAEPATRLPRVVLDVLLWRCLIAISAAWALVVVFGLSTGPGRRYEHLATYRFDLGNMTQAVWSTAHGRPLEVTLASGEQATRLGVHVDPILAAFAPLWWIFPSPLLLLVVQAGALASGALAVCRLAERVLASTTIGFILGSAYLLYPWLVWQAHGEFHPVTLALPALLWCAWFLIGGRHTAFWIVAGMALLCGELVGLGLAGLGLWYAIRSRSWRRGGAIAVAGVGWTAVCLWIVIPAFSGGTSPFYDRFESVGGSPGGLARTALTDPVAVLSAASSSDDLAYLALLVVPLAGFVVWAPLALLGAVPQLALNLLSDWSATTSPGNQYVAVVVPFLFLATVFGLARFTTLRRRLIGATIVFAACAGSFAMFAPSLGLLVPPHDARPTTERLGHTSREAVRKAVALVPDDAAVSATNRIAGRLSERRYIYSAPVIGRAVWVVIDKTDGWIPQIGARQEGVDRGRIERMEGRLRRDPIWRRVYARDGVTVFEKRAGGAVRTEAAS